MSVPFKANDLILFTGDSVTDCDRNRNDPVSLGFGYAGSIARQLGMNFKDLDLRIQNTGISGNRTCDLIDRWNTDCIDLQPDWVSILVGVNNTWRRYDHDDPTQTPSLRAKPASYLNESRKRPRKNRAVRALPLEYKSCGLSHA